MKTLRILIQDDFDNNKYDTLKDYQVETHDDIMKVISDYGLIHYHPVQVFIIDGVLHLFMEPF